MITFDAAAKTMSFTKPLKVSELESYLKTFRVVYKDIDTWTIMPSGGASVIPSDPEEASVVKPEMPPLDTIGEDFNLKD
jgi:hypothetical protein